MTRKDFEEFAQLIRCARVRFADTVGSRVIPRSEVVDFFMVELANLYARENPRFDRARFAKACEPGVEVPR